MPTTRRAVDTSTMLAKCPPDTRLLEGMWVYNIKLDGLGVIIKPKARYVT